MIRKLGAVSLLALGLVAGAALAQEGEPAPGEAPVEQAPAETAPAEAPAAEAAPVEQAPAVAAVPAEVQALLDDTRPVSEIETGELRNRARAARGFAKQQGLPDEVRGRLQQIAQEARAELDARANQQKAAEPEQPPAPAEQPVEQAAPAEPPPAPAEQPVEQPVEQAAPAEPPPAEPPPVETQAEQAAPVEQAAPAEEPPAPAEQPVEQAAPASEPAAPVEQPPAAAQEQAAPAAPPVVDKKEVQELDANAGNPEAEKKARAYLADETPVDSLSDDELKARLDGMRDLMADNELSQKTERALRKKLQAEREVLRARIAAKEAAVEQEKLKAEAARAAEQQKKAEQEAAAQGTAPKGDKGNKKPRIVIVPQITINTPVTEVLRDRRRSEDLSDSELRRRVKVFRDAQSRNDWEDFDEQDQMFWRESMRRDRELLRRRMAEERRQRQEELAMNEDDFDFEVVDEFQPGRKAPRNVFEAEADDEELEEILIAPPKKKVRQRYTIEDIADREELRDAMPRIEIDTIRFGFNEAFVREEEVDSLDRIAAIIERVLRKRPREVFLIEGHTDAVGSDAYNLKLSRARAEAVKKALTTYYVISPRNLQTVGLGERYLKIPTAEPEGENRRVSISRATPLVGELDE
jgi:outer membrane protein OmpA-like peptidoglycan-associated protein